MILLNERIINNLTQGISIDYWLDYTCIIWREYVFDRIDDMGPCCYGTLIFGPTPMGNGISMRNTVGIAHFYR